MGVEQCCDNSKAFQLRPINEQQRDENYGSIARNSGRLPSFNNQKIQIEYIEGVWGHAYPLVLLLQYQSVAYEYHEVSQEGWRKRRLIESQGEIGTLPIVNYKGQQMQGITAVLRAIGSEHGYYNATDWKKCAKIDMIVEIYANCLEECAKILY